MTDATCSIEGCERIRLARGWCATHYRRWRVTGTTDLLERPSPSAVERFFAKVIESDTCWVWTASLSRTGYGVFRDEGRNHMAHRWAYEFMVAPIPNGLHIDHLCSVRTCVNPDHLEPVPQAVNNQRSRAGEVNKARLSGATHCQRGHEFTPENTRIIHDGRHRQCKTCHRAAVNARKRRIRKKAI